MVTGNGARPASAEQRLKELCRKLTFERGTLMKISKRITKISLLIFGLLLLASASWAQKCPPAAEKIAQAYGIDSFGQIDAVRSTFKIDFPGLKVAQTWIWEPKADRVTYEGKDKDGNSVKATYVRSQLASQPESVKNEIDPSFNNDQYWLWLPFHACWDTRPRSKIQACTNCRSAGVSPGVSL
jgi:hypothetical protein